MVSPVPVLATHMYRVEVSLKSHLPDARGQGLVKDIVDLGIDSVHDVRVIDVYWLDTDLPPDVIDPACRRIFSDAVTQDYLLLPGDAPAKGAGDGYHAVEVAFNAGVTDPIEDSIMKAIRDMGVADVKAVKTARKYLIKGRLEESQLSIIASRLLVNPIIQHVVKDEHVAFPENPRYRFDLKHIDILGSGVLPREFGFTPEE